LSILRSLQKPGHVAEALDHINEALDALEQRRSKTYIAERLFDGFNKLQTEWTIDQADLQRREMAAFKGMILQGVSFEARNNLLESRELQSLVALEPQIMNHDTLRSRQYRPDVDTPREVVQEATQEHRKLVSAFHNWKTDGGHEETTRLLRLLADLLYVTRCNIKHGEKTPYGRDLKKLARDESVCAVITPVQFMLADILLGTPSAKLVVYGSLAPGEPNHDVLADISGEWQQCYVRGAITISSGLRRLNWNPVNDEVAVNLFTSTGLPLQWQRLDSFEGTSYKRRLIPVRTDAHIQIANVYLAR
jgi:gamma-glutamylcyclotransferase (GGCT)/AIG2-like uncharacterized protein YtfP